ncbi:MAG: response regulator [Deltaproteobacteria bacterium]|nr:response regulator [Deltaproteobacteria bacterium]
MKTRGSILVVDDENTVLLLLGNELEETGYDACRAASAQEALQALEKESFDVALVDKNLPDMDGIELLRRMRLSDPEMELIVMTGYASLDSALDAIEIGIFDYITKPFDHMSGVMQRVSRAVEKRRQKEELRQLTHSLSAANLQLASSMQSLRRTYLETAIVISRILAMRDPVRFGENEKIRSLCVRTAVGLGLDAETVEWLSAAALLHDLGEAGEIEQLESKPRPLSPEEYQKVKRHSDIGADLVKSISGFEPLAGIIRCHHERHDGSGYPCGLCGESIPIGARVLGVADSYIAMISRRPFRQAMSREKAVELIRGYAGTRFDPRVVEVFIEVERTFEWEDSSLEECAR